MPGFLLQNVQASWGRLKNSSSYARDPAPGKSDMRTQGETYLSQPACFQPTDRHVSSLPARKKASRYPSKKMGQAGQI